MEKLSGASKGTRRFEAEHGAQLVLRRGDHSRIRNDDQHVLLHVGEHLVHGEVRDQDARIVLAGELVGRAVHHTDDLQLVAVHRDAFVNRVFVGQQLLLQVFADHHYRHMMLVLEIAEEAAEFHGRAARGVRLFRSAELDIVDVVPLVAGAVYAARREQKRADVRHRRTPLGNRARILVGQRLAPALLAGGLPHGGGFGHDHGLRAEALKQAGNRAVEAGDDRPDADHGAGPDDDAEHGQKGAHLVLAGGSQRQLDAVADGCHRHFSTLNASIGSSRAARCAG